MLYWPSQPLLRKRCVSQQNVINKLEAERVDLQFLFYLKFCNYALWLENCGQRRTNFFFEKEDFLKNGYGCDFETFTNEFLAKNCIRISRHLRTKFFSPKLEIGYTVWL